MRPGSRPFWKLTGSALAALALAFACGAARAQEYPYADGLRADSDDASMARAVPTDETSDPTADTDRARPPKKPKANAKGASIHTEPSSIARAPAQSASMLRRALRRSDCCMDVSAVGDSNC